MVKKARKFFLKLLDFLGGLFLVMTGLFLLFLYACLYTKADNWLISFAMLLFLLGLGIAAIIFGARRAFITLKK